MICIALFLTVLPIVSFVAIFGPLFLARHMERWANVMWAGLAGLLVSILGWAVLGVLCFVFRHYG